MSEVPRMIQSIESGEAKPADELLPLVYEELRKLATHKMANDVPGQTLQPTALVHEAWLRLTSDADSKWDSRAHFFGAAAQAMHRILIESARRRRALRHGGGQQRLDIQQVAIAAATKEEELLAVSEALEKFAALDPRKADLVKLRYLAGLTIEEAARMLGISAATAKRWWTYSRAWLYQEAQRASRE